MLVRRPMNVVIVALANKMARTAWADHAASSPVRHASMVSCGAAACNSTGRRKGAG